MNNICTISPKDFQDKIGQKDTLLIDIRTSQEKIDYGYLENTDLLLDMYSPTFGDDILQLDKTKKYLVYCWHANRSAFLLKFMAGNGFENVFELEGGIDLWGSMGLEIKKD